MIKMYRLLLPALLVAVISLVATPVSSQGGVTLYGVAYEHYGQDLGGGPATLYTIDIATGAATPVGPIGFNMVGGIDYDFRAGVLCGISNLLGEGGEGLFLTIDPATGAGAEVGPTVGAQDISFRPSDSRLYAFSDGHLGTINTLTGEPTHIGDTGYFGAGNGIAFSPVNILYLAHSPYYPEDPPPTLYILNQNTGARTFVTDLIFPPDLTSPRINAMDFHPSTGVLYASLNTAGDLTNYLATVDITTGNVAIIGRTVDGLDAIAFYIQHRPVAGVIVPVNKLEVLAPYVALAGLVAAVTIVTVKIRSRKPE